MIPPAKIDPRFNESFIEAVWRLFAEFGFRPSIRQTDISLAVYLLSKVTEAYEGRAE